MGMDYKESVVNFYRHRECGSHWVDLWNCGCNDRCPKCNAEIEPYISLGGREIEAMIRRCRDHQRS